MGQRTAVAAAVAAAARTDAGAEGIRHVICANAVGDKQRQENGADEDLRRVGMALLFSERRAAAAAAASSVVSGKQGAPSSGRKGAPSRLCRAVHPSGALAYSLTHPGELPE